MNPAFLTQQQLIAQLRDDLGLHASPERIHEWIREGMPLPPRGGKKPRFVFAHVRAWLLGQDAATTPLSQQVRDRLFLSGLKKGA